MKIGKIIKIVVCILVGIIILTIIVRYLHRHLSGSPMLLPKVSDAMETHTFSSNKLPLAGINGGTEFTFTFWIYITTWGYKYGFDKTILFWKGKSPPQHQKCREINQDETFGRIKEVKKEVKKKKECHNCPKSPLLEDFTGSYQAQESMIDTDNYETPSIIEGFEQQFGNFNGLKVALASKENALEVSYTNITGKNESIKIPDLPIQKWLNITIVLQLRNLDVFINGELEKSLLLSSLPSYQKGRLSVNPNGGFNGLISRLQYFNRAILISEIQKIFHKGPISKNPLLSNGVGRKMEGGLAEVGGTALNIVEHPESSISKLGKGLKKGYHAAGKLAEDSAKDLLGKRNPAGHKCGTPIDCKPGLSCIQGHCGYQQHSREEGQTCWGNMSCHKGLTCNNNGPDRLTEKERHDLSNYGLESKDNWRWNRELGGGPFTCVAHH